MSQKVIKIGSSLGVTIPKSEIAKLHIMPGDEVDITIQKKVTRLAKHEKLLKSLESFMNTYDKDLRQLSKK